MKSLFTKIICVLTAFTLCVGFTACKNSCNTIDDKCASGHTWELTSTTTTCYNSGIENYTCKVCKTTKTEEVSAYGHDLVLVSYNAPTCKTTGLELKRCSRCNFESSKTLLQVDHDYEVKSTTPSTCTVHGSQTLECLMCHETKTDTLPLKDHDYELKSTTDSTCITHGHNYYQCKDCTDSYSAELPFAAHKYETTHKEATCFTHGGTVEKCSVCQDEKPTTETPILTHDFGADGYCSKCGIYETLFDETKLSIRHTSATLLGWIGGELVPKFKDTGTIVDSYWKEHSVIVTVYLYDQDNELLGEKEFASQIDSNGKITIQSTQQTQLQDSRPNQISLRLQADGAFPLDTLNACKSYKIKLSCDGYKTTEKTYQINN